MRTGQTIHGVGFDEDTSDILPERRATAQTVRFCVFDGVPVNAEELLPTISAMVPELDGVSLLRAIQAGIDEAEQAGIKKPPLL